MIEEIKMELPFRERDGLIMRLMMTTCGCDDEKQRGQPWAEINNEDKMVWKAWARAFYQVRGGGIFYIDDRIGMSDGNPAKETRRMLSAYIERADRRVLLPVVHHKPSDPRAFGYWNRRIAHARLITWDRGQGVGETVIFQVYSFETVSL